MNTALTPDLVSLPENADALNEMNSMHPNQNLYIILSTLKTVSKLVLMLTAETIKDTEVLDRLLHI